MPIQKSLILDWGRARARALIARRGVYRGLRVRMESSGSTRLEPWEWTAPGPGEILARTLFSAVSPGTERAHYNRLANTAVEYPRTPGYSGAGRVEEVGPGVADFRPGDRVAGPFPHASATNLPARECFRVPEGVPEAEAAFLALGVIALQGVRKAGLLRGDRVAVLGRGILGLFSASVARRAGASEVVHVGRPGRAQVGGAEAAAGEAGGRALGRFEVVLDVTGNPDAVADAARIVSPGGRIVLLGSPRGVSPPLPADLIDRRAFEIRGAHAQMVGRHESAPGLWTMRDEGDLYLTWLADGSLRQVDLPKELLDPRECWRFYRRLARGEPPVVAALFDWRGLPPGEALRRSTFLPPVAVVQDDPVRESMKARVAGQAPGRRFGRGMKKTVAQAGVSGTARGRTLGLALIGCGEIAIRNAEAIVRSGSATLLWAVDSNQALAADVSRRCGGRAGTSVAEALGDRAVDAVFICTPHHLHAPLALEAIRAGKHVLVEKPTARDAAEAAVMIDAAQAAGVRLATCYPLRFFPHVQAARTLVREEGLGRIQGARIVEHLYKEMAYWHGGSTGRSRSSWRSEREKSGGGILMMNLCHHLDTLFFVSGQTALRVYGEADRFDAPGDVEDAVAFTLRLSGGAIVSVDASSSAPGGGTSLFQIWGSDGQAALDPPARFLSLRKTSLGRPNVWNRLPAGREIDARSAFISAFAAAALEGGPDPVPAAEALAVQSVIDAVYLSARRAEPVSLSGSRERRGADVASKT